MKKKIDIYFIALHVAVVALCVVSLLLALENRRLKQPTSAGFDAAGPAIGQSVETVAWRPIDGDVAQTLDLAGGERESLLLVFTTDCPACRENQALWRGLHERVGDAVNVVGVSLSGLEATRSYRDAHQLPFPVGIAAEPGRFVGELAITGVPMTIRVNARGRVSGSWSGVLSDDQVAAAARSDRS